MIDNIQDELTLLSTVCALIGYFFYKFKIHKKIKRIINQWTLAYKWIPFFGKYWAFRKSGISTIFASQKDIEKYRRYSKIEDYIDKNTYDSFTYIGIWLSNEENRNELEKIVAKILKEPHVNIKLYFHNPEITPESRQWLSEYYDRVDIEIEKEIQNCVDGWKKFKDSIGEITKKERLGIYLHNCNLTFSVFLFNIDSEKKKKRIIFYDQKLYRTCKERSISMEIGYCEESDSLYKRILNMCQKVINSGVSEL